MVCYKYEYLHIIFWVNLSDILIDKKLLVMIRQGEHTFIYH